MKVKTISVIWAPSTETGSDSLRVRGSLVKKGKTLPNTYFGLYLSVEAGGPPVIVKTYETPFEADAIEFEAREVSSPHTLLVNGFKIPLPAVYADTVYTVKLPSEKFTWLVLGAIAIVAVIALTYKKD